MIGKAAAADSQFTVCAAKDLRTFLVSVQPNTADQSATDPGSQMIMSVRGDSSTGRVKTYQDATLILTFLAGVHMPAQLMTWNMTVNVFERQLLMRIRKDI